MAGLQVYLAFIETAKHGGFAGAARELGLTPSAVAKAVARLEDDLGLRLFHRTTRQVALTGEGRELFERCRSIVDAVAALHDEAAGVRSEPAGTLRINVPIVLGRQWVVPVLAELRHRYPKLAFAVGFSDRYVDVVQEGLDAVVRVGELPDSTLVAQRIGEQSLVVVGAPAYFAANPPPADLAALESHACLVFRMPSSGRLRPWQFQDGQTALTLTPPSTLCFDDGEALVTAAEAGMGLVQVPDYLAAGGLAAGRLVEVLKAFRPPAAPVWIAYPSARRVTPRLKALVDALIARRSGPGAAA